MAEPEVPEADMVAVLVVLPVTVAIAIVRHDLLDVDRLLGATASWVVTAIVSAGVFTVVVVGVAGLGSRRLGEDPRAPSHTRPSLHGLSAREREVLALVAEGRSNTAISRALVVAERTVEAHMRSIFQKLRLVDSGDDHRRVLAVLAVLAHLTT